MRKQSVSQGPSAAFSAFAAGSRRACASSCRAAHAARILLLLDTIFMVSIFVVLGSVLLSLINITLLGLIAVLVIPASLLILAGILLPLISLTILPPLFRPKER